MQCVYRLKLRKQNSMDFNQKLILAPMVRIGMLPMRLLSLEYGCDIVYCEEIIDHKMLQTKRIVNPVLNSVDFIIPGEQYPIFQTCPAEKGKIVFQMGTCDAERALKVGKLVEDDVAAIDVNMGCPKTFSIQARMKKGGMGAALLTQPEKIKKILTTLVNGLKKPVTCKIRILPKVEETIALAKLIESCGVTALAVHGRTKDERPQHDNHNDVIKQIAESLSIPVIANGGSKQIVSFDDLAKFRHNAGSSSVMLARCAMLNPSVFRSSGLLDINSVIESYLKHACDYDSCPALVKYTIQLFLQDALQKTERGKKFLDASSLKEFCCLWGLEDYYMKQKAKQRDRLMRTNFACNRIENVSNETIFKNAICLNIPYIRKHFDNLLPKNILINYCLSNGLDAPSFTSVTVDKKFISVVEIDEKRFYSSFIEKNKRSAEQAASFVAVLALNLEKNLPSICFDDVPLNEVKLKLSKNLNPESFCL